jgi:hypothetical protein
MAPRPAERRIGFLVLNSAITTRRGAGSALFLLFVTGWVFAAVAWAWAVWTAAQARAQQTVRLDLGYAAENLVPPEALLGEWHAVISRDGKPQPVSLAIKDVTPGKTAGKMTFASPRRCVIDLEYGGPDQGRHIFYMIRFTNCFDYGRTDFVALAQVPGEDIAALHEDDTEEKSNRSVEILKKFGLGQPEPEAAQEGTQESTGATDNDPAAAPPKGLGRIVYAINLAGEVHDSAILKRQ